MKKWNELLKQMKYDNGYFTEYSESGDGTIEHIYYKYNELDGGKTLMASKFNNEYTFKKKTTYRFYY